jgi:hypothetical protein
MPVAVSYTGVYIQEVPSGVATITGVATSIGAFVDGFSAGPMNEATEVLILPILKPRSAGWMRAARQVTGSNNFSRAAERKPMSCA